MEREHLIIIALILVALYMMNTDDKKQDKVKAIGPMGRIRYVDPFGANCADGSPPPCREGFMQPDAQQGKQDFGLGQHIRYSDKNFAQSQHIKNHIRSRNTNSMFSGMTTGSCGEGFRFTDDDPANCVDGICG